MFVIFRKLFFLVRPLHDSYTPLIRLAAASIGGLVLATFPGATREGNDKVPRLRRGTSISPPYSRAAEGGERHQA